MAVCSCDVETVVRDRRFFMDFVVVANAYKTICLCSTFMRRVDGFCTVVSKCLYFARAYYSAVIVNCMLDSSF